MLLGTNVFAQKRYVNVRAYCDLTLGETKYLIFLSGAIPPDMENYYENKNSGDILNMLAERGYEFEQMSCNNSTGNTGTVTLSQAVTNFTYITIYYRSSGHYSSKTILSSYNNVVINLPFIYDGAYYDRLTEYTISGSKITYAKHLTVNHNFNTVTTASAEIQILRVDGWK
jgi:hypothetical protein